MKYLKQFSMLAIYFMAFSCALNAQEKLPTVKVRTLALDRGFSEKVFGREPGGFESLSFSHAQPSPETLELVVEEGGLRLYQEKQTADGKLAMSVVRGLAIPETADRLLLLSYGRADSQSGYVAVTDNYGSGDARNWLLINATPAPIAFKLGEETKPVSVEPGTSAPYRVEVDPGQGAVVLAAAFEEASWRRIYSTFWPVRDDRRSLVIFVPDGDSVSVKRFSELLAPAREEASGENL